MKENTHPKYEEVNVICSCGNKFTTRSTINKKDLHLEVCANCHPFYTGKQKLMDTAGRVDRFKKKYANQKIIQEKTAEKIAAEQALAAETPSKSKTSKAKTATKAKQKTETK